MERPSQPTLTRQHHGPDSPPGFGIMPHGPQKDSETIPRASAGNLQSFAILGIPSSANYSNYFPRSSWHERPLSSSFIAIARQPTYKFSIAISTIYIPADIHLSLFVRFCIANNIRICVYTDDILLVLPDYSDINID
jgi:hypothetical protein